MSGPPGAGKSTLAREIAERLKLRYHSTGMLFREIARARGVSVEELDRIAENDPEIDLKIDQLAKEIAREGGVVVEGHIAGWILRDMADILIYVTAPLDIRAKRIAERDKLSYSQALEAIRRREESMRRRFKKLYNIDLDSHSHFDIVINTRRISKDKMIRIALAAIEDTGNVYNIKQDKQ